AKKIKAAEGLQAFWRFRWRGEQDRHREILHGSVEHHHDVPDAAQFLVEWIDKPAIQEVCGGSVERRQIRQISDVIEIESSANGVDRVPKLGAIQFCALKF